MLFRDQIRVLLHQIQGPVNLGAVCRAMANTGFAKLRFSGSLSRDHAEARKYAVHAHNLLKEARKCRSFETLIAGMDRLYGFSPRQPWDDGRGLALDDFHERLTRDLESGRRVGLLFGNEAHGLSNRHLAHCDGRVSLPTVTDYASMNLAQAVTVVLWEIHRRFPDSAAREPLPEPELATPAAKRRLLENLREFMETLELLNPQNPELIWREMVPLFKTRDWTRREMDLLQVLFNKGRSRYRALLKKGSKAPNP